MRGRNNRLFLRFSGRQRRASSRRSGRGARRRRLDDLLWPASFGVKTRGAARITSVERHADRRSIRERRRRGDLQVEALFPGLGERDRLARAALGEARSRRQAHDQRGGEIARGDHLDVEVERDVRAIARCLQPQLHRRMEPRWSGVVSPGGCGWRWKRRGRVGGRRRRDRRGWVGRPAAGGIHRHRRRPGRGRGRRHWPRIGLFAADRTHGDRPDQSAQRHRQPPPPPTRPPHPRTIGRFDLIRSVRATFPIR
jgi:hypothetical protein